MGANTVHISQPLSNVSIAYSNPTYIAEKVFRTIPVVKQTDRYFIYLRGAQFRDEAGYRAPGGEAPRGKYALSNDTYYCNEIAFAENITDEDRLNADAPLDPDVDGTEHATDKILLKKERIVAAKVLTSTNWANGHNMDCEGTWVAGAGNTFIADVNAGITQILNNTGYRPNVMLMDGATLMQVKAEETVLDRIKYTERGIVTPPLIAAIFELEEVLIGDSLYSTAKEKLDDSDFTAAKIWEVNAGKGSAVLLYRPPAAGRKVAAAGYLYQWKLEGGLVRRTKRWREESRHQDVVEAAEAFDAKVTGSSLGYLFSDTIST